MDEDAEPPELMENNASATARPELIQGWVEVEVGGRRAVGPFVDRPVAKRGPIHINPLGMVAKTAEAQFRTTNDQTRGGVNPLIHEDTARVSLQIDFQSKCPLLLLNFDSFN